MSKDSGLVTVLPVEEGGSDTVDGVVTSKS